MEYITYAHDLRPIRKITKKKKKNGEHKKYESVRVGENAGIVSVLLKPTRGPFCSYVSAHWGSVAIGGSVAYW